MADQESNISLLFKSIEAEFEAYERIDDPKRAEAKLSLLTSMIRDSKGLIKEFEREARVDGRPTEEIVAAKQRYVNQVNSYVARKKQAAAELKSRTMQSTPTQQSTVTASAYATPPASSEQQPASQKQVQDMTNREIVMHGRQRMDETDAELQQGKKIVTETEDVAVKTAAQLKNQTDQMGRVVDDLNEIEFSMQRASKVIRDITRGLATDKCIMSLVCLVAVGIVVAIALKILGVGDDGIELPGPEDDSGPETEPDANNGNTRRLLGSFATVVLQRAAH